MHCSTVMALAGVRPSLVGDIDAALSLTGTYWFRLMRWSRMLSNSMYRVIIFVRLAGKRRSSGLAADRMLPLALSMTIEL